jgi:N-ethylmaleimide reductase
LSPLRLGELTLKSRLVMSPMTAPPAGTRRVAPVLRERFKGALILNGGYDAQSANAAIARGDADLVAFGVPFLANPDLPFRYANRAPLNAPDQATFYAGEAKGYTDYPALAGAA